MTLEVFARAHDADLLKEDLYLEWVNCRILHLTALIYEPSIFEC